MSAVWGDRMEPRRFFLRRDSDHTGVSGIGVVAEGIEFTDGVVALRWIVPPDQPGTGMPTSVVFHDNGIASVERIHGHGGATQVVFLDPDTATGVSIPEGCFCIGAAEGAECQRIHGPHG